MLYRLRNVVNPGAEGVIFGETELEIVWMEQMLTGLASRSE